MIPAIALLLAAAPLPEVVVTGPRRPFAAPPVAPRELAVLRGRLLLPNGLDVAIGIDLQTRIGGTLVLHTIYASEGARPGIQVYTDGTDAPPIAPATVTVNSPAVPGVPLVIADGSPTGTTVVPTAAVAATTVNLVNGDPSTWLDASGEVPVPVAPGQPADIAPGRVTLDRDEAGAVVTLRGADFEIRQLIGRATGVVVANTGSDRVIDTVSSVNVDVKGLSPVLLSGVFAAQRAVIDALTRQ